jgi:hypothetical protein
MMRRKACKKHHIGAGAKQRRNGGATTDERNLCRWKGKVKRQPAEGDRRSRNKKDCKRKRGDKSEEVGKR